MLGVLTIFFTNTGYPYSKQIQFSTFTSQDVVKLAEFQVTHRDLYTPTDRLPVKNGVLDRRLGTSDKSAFCETCGLGAVDCVGHYAYIKLVVPVFHIGYFKHAIGVLQVICKVCTLKLSSDHEVAGALLGIICCFTRLDLLTRPSSIICSAFPSSRLYSQA